MSRFLGVETEYGIATPSDPALSPIVTSTHAVVAYAALRTGSRSRWDYDSEKPLADARGFDLKRYRSVPVVAADTVGVANVVTSTGARYYVDHAHPEYASPECSNAWEGMLYDAAGDHVVLSSVKDLEGLREQGVSVLKDHEPCPPLKIYKNNVDGKGASYGSHENYQYSRHTDFDRLTQSLLPFFVTRQVIIGAGRVGIGERGESPGFQISQRADYFFQEVSLETTLNRGIVNSRDEPHADPAEFRRLHVIVGDANMSHTASFLKLGMTKLVIDAIESGVNFSDLALDDPVSELRDVSRDLTLKHRLSNGFSAIDTLRAYRDRVQPTDSVDRQVIDLWGEVLEDLGQNPLSTADRLDWTAKLALMQRYIDRGASWSDAKLQLIDLQYSDIDPDKGLYHALVRSNRMRTLVDSATITRAATVPPSNSRAYFRGRVCAEFGDDVLAASWQSLQLRHSHGVATYHLDDVDKFNAVETKQLLDASHSVDDLVAALPPHV